MNLKAFEDLTKKRQELLELLKALPDTMVHGVVGARGVAGSKVGREPDWNMGVELLAWRVPGSPVHHSQLYLSKRVTDAELKAFRDAIRPESLIAFRSKLCEEGPFGRAEAELSQVLEQPADEELQAILVAFQEPVEIVDAILGILTLNRKIDHFEGKARWSSREIEISIAPDNTGDASSVIETMKALLDNQEYWSKEAEESIVSQLLDIKNDNWLGEDESPLHEHAFIARTRLESITAYRDGEFELWYNDGDLFWGHAILVAASLAQGIRRVEIAG